MKAAIDASVLIFFAKMQKLGALLEIFPNLHMSQTVFNEIMEGKKHGFLESIEIEKFVNGKKIVLDSKKQKSGISGEDSTILLAKRKKISTLLMDDFAGIKKAGLFGLKAYSCPFILLKALESKKISKDEFARLLEKLLSFNNFISPRLLKKIIELAEQMGS